MSYFGDVGKNLTWQGGVKGALDPFGIFGGGDDEEASPPTLMEVLSQFPEAAQYLMDTSKSIAPQQSQLQLDLLREYGIPIAQTQKSAFDQLYPELSQLPDFFANQAMEGSMAGLTSNEQRILNDAIRSNLGEQAISPIGTQRLGADLMNATLARQAQYQNIGTALAGRVPLFQAQTPNYTDYAGQLNAANVMGFGQNAYNQLPVQEDGMSQLMSGLGSILPLVVGGMTGGVGTAALAAVPSIMGGMQSQPRQTANYAGYNYNMSSSPYYQTLFA